MKSRVLIELAALAALALFGIACNEEEPPDAPGSFDRPTKVAFACFDVSQREDPQPVALACCDLSRNDVRGCGDTRALHALVVQSSRGEVAAVDLREGRTLDSREDIPGYTFLAVGELPTAIVVPAGAGRSRYTYVLSAGSRDVTVLKTRAFRTLAAREQATLQTVMLPGEGRDAPVDMVLSPNEDALFVSIPQSGRVLRLPIRRCAADSGDDCVDGEIDSGAITELDLSPSVARAVPAPAGMSIEPYSKTCEYAGPIENRVLEVPPLPADAATTVPRPSGLAVDNFCERDRPCSPRLLVADAALPLIHVVDLAQWRAGPTGAAIQPPILTGAPTSTVVVTPRVPVSTAPDADETQYVYAIDAVDGSVLVTENGRLLEVGAVGGRPDRVTLGAGSNLPRAVSLTVLTPSFDIHGPAAQYAREPDPNQALPDPNSGAFCIDRTHTQRFNTRLRGVFLGVGVSDGSARIIDVHDMDLAECRNCPGSYRPGCRCSDDPASEQYESNRCDRCAWKNTDPYPVVRHRARIAPTAPPGAQRAALAPFARPVYLTRNDQIQVRITGTTSDPALQGLGCVACTGGQVPAFPEVAITSSSGSDDDAGVGSGFDEDDLCRSGEARVCALADPWAELDDWTAIYRGVLPGSRGGQGRFTRSDARVEFRSERSYCGLGVLAEDQLAGNRNRADQITIESRLATDQAIRDALPNDVDDVATLRACKELVNQRDRAADPRPIAFRIREAYDDRLIIEPRLLSRPRGIDAGFEDDVEFVNTCFANTLLAHQLRAGEGYLVLGRNAAGFVHRVIAEPDSGRCVIDETQDAKRVGRAYAEVPFDNGRVAFVIAPGSSVEIDTALLLALQTSTQKTVLNATVSINEQVFAAIPYDLRWSDTDNILYMVDVSERGLLQIPVDPFPINGSVRDFQ